MSDTKTRTLEEIQNEYTNVCTQAGNAQYQLYVIEDQLDGFNKRLRELNQEAFNLKATQDAKKLEAVQDPTPAPSEAPLTDISGAV